VLVSGCGEPLSEVVFSVLAIMMGAVRLHCLDGIWDCWCHVVIWVVIVAGVLCVAVDCVNAIDASASVWKVL